MNGCRHKSKYQQKYYVVVEQLKFGVWVYSLISSPFPYICVCVCFSNKKRYSVLSSHPTSVWCDIEKGFITYSTTLIVACSFGVGMWVYSLISSPFSYICVCVCVCVCVCFSNKKRYSVLSSHPTSVRCDIIEKGFITCSATLTVACNFGVGVWVYPLSHPPSPIYVCVCVCVCVSQIKKDTQCCRVIPHQ